MDIKISLLLIRFGIVIGLVLASKIGIGNTNIVNEIDKIKTTGDNTSVNADLTSNAKQKRGLFNRIFKKKKP